MIKTLSAPSNLTPPPDQTPLKSQGVGHWGFEEFNGVVAFQKFMAPFLYHFHFNFGTLILYARLEFEIVSNEALHNYVYLWYFLDRFDLILPLKDKQRNDRYSVKYWSIEGNLSNAEVSRVSTKQLYIVLYFEYSVQRYKGRAGNATI